MSFLPPLADVLLPDVKPDEMYAGRFLDQDVSFQGLKALLAAADFSKAGDRHAGLAAASEKHREAARAIPS